MATFDETFHELASGIAAPTEPHLVPLLAESVRVVRNGIMITDADLDRPGPRIVYVNPRFEQITGYTSDEVVGREPRFLQGPATDRAVLDRLRADLTAGRPFQGETINYRKDGTPFIMSWRIAAIRDGDGRPAYYVAVQEDLTDLRRVQSDHHDLLAQSQGDARWLEELVALSMRLVTASRPDQVWSEAVDCAVDRLGALAAAVVSIDPLESTVVEARRGPKGRSQQGEAAPHTLAALQDVLTQREPQFFGDLDELWTTYPDLADVCSRVGLGCAALLPLRAGEVRAGMILGWERSRPFHATERHHLTVLASLVSEGFAQTAALEAHRSLAVHLQTALLPTVPRLEDLEVCWRYHPAGDQSLVGGDWYDVVPLPDGRTAVFVGDVVGHGNQAAALMGEIRFTVRGLLRGTQDPGRLLDELDQCLAANHRPSEALATMSAVVVAPDGDVAYAIAGHPQPVVRRADRTVGPLPSTDGRMVGLDPDGPPRRTATARLEPGDVLLAFSDGLFERRGEDYDTSYASLMELFARAGDGLAELCDAAVTRTGDGAARRDDVVVVALRRPA